MKTKEIILPSNRKFGMVFSIFFILATSYYFYNNDIFFSIFFLVISSIFLILTIFFSNLLSPLNYAWYKFGILLGRFINPVVMGILFYFLISPIAIFLRILGRDELRIKDKNLKSFWLNKKIEKNFTSFKNQY